MSINIEKERAAFEAVARRITHAQDFEREGESYSDYVLSTYWDFWLAAKRDAISAQADDAKIANRVRDLIADHVADNWPMARYHLELVEKKLRAIRADHLLAKHDAAIEAHSKAGKDGGQ